MIIDLFDEMIDTRLKAEVEAKTEAAKKVQFAAQRRAKDKALAKAPYTDGELDVLGAYLRSKKKGYEQIVMDSNYSYRGHADSLSLLRKVGVESFVVTGDSNYLMDTLHGFLMAGATVTGAMEFEKTESANSYDRAVKGLVLAVN